jgi:hypothetical protein
MTMNRTLRLEHMEERTLMAVAVAFSPSTGQLRITGTDLSERVEIDGTGYSGEVIVTENPALDPVIRGTFTGVKSIYVSMAGGHDTVFAAGVAIPGSLQVLGGLGSDAFVLDNQPEYSGKPATPIFIGGSLSANLGGQLDDRVYWSADAGLGGTVARNLTIAGANRATFTGHDGTGAAVESTDINVGGNVSIRLSGPSEATFSAALSNVNVYGSTSIIGTAIAERISLQGANFLGRVGVNLGGGDDYIEVGNGYRNRFNSAVVVNFGAGSDTLVQPDGNYFAVPMVILGGPEFSY